MAWVTLTHIDISQRDPKTKEPIVLEYDVLYNTDLIVKIVPNANRISCTLHYENPANNTLVKHSLAEAQEKLRGVDNTHWVDNSKPKAPSVSSIPPLNPEPAPKAVVHTKAKGTTSGALE
jgi:hypothetical protein